MVLQIRLGMFIEMRRIFDVENVLINKFVFNGFWKIVVSKIQFIIR